MQIYISTHAKHLVKCKYKYFLSKLLQPFINCIRNVIICTRFTYNNTMSTLHGIFTPSTFKVFGSTVQGIIPTEWKNKEKFKWNFTSNTMSITYISFWTIQEKYFDVNICSLRNFKSFRAVSLAMLCFTFLSVSSHPVLGACSCRMK